MIGRPAPSVRFETIVREALAAGATDVHFEPRDRGLEIRLRIDGRLMPAGMVDERHREALIQAAKIAGRLDIAERRLPQDGRGALGGSRPCSLRFSCIPAVNGESVVVRLLDEQTRVRPWTELDLSDECRRHLGELLAAPDGLIYVTGPTGSGKTTLLHALLAGLPRTEADGLKIITLEEPVEIRNPRCFLQLEVDERIGRSFGELLRHVLRHDPDLLLVGETRDQPTAEITLRAALAGRLCLSTLHTNTALGAVPRLTELGMDPLLVSSALRGLIAQRLVRVPCPSCRREHPQAAQWRERSGIWSGEFVSAETGRECPVCRGRGYRGRIALLEVVPMRGLEAMVADRVGVEALELEARRLGHPALFEDGLRLAARGLTTIEEVCAVAPPPLPLCPNHPSPAMKLESHSSSPSRPRAAAFTLIETLAVLAVIAAVIAIGVPAVSKVLQSARIRNTEGTAAVVRSALLQFLSKPGATGSMPVTEGTAAALTSEYTGAGTPTAAAVAAAATLDGVLLSEGTLERPISIRMGAQNVSATGASNGFFWIPATQSFTGTAAPTLTYAAVSRAECSVSDGLSNPGVTGQAAGSAACAFNLAGNGSFLPSGVRVAYMIVKSVPDSDAYQLALDVDGLPLTQNTAAAPAANDQSQGPVAYAKDAAAAGFVDVYYYLTNI